ncbi:hypothetical protein ACKGJO_05420 [Gracilimonas sp. Q87]|uniref:hypothetical protein n=1 Tax=Gracilimonas sp. Q87 TaxID=3384766 RepID=UPI003983E103
MKKFLLIFLLPLFVISCSSSDIKDNRNNQNNTNQVETLEVVDIRIYENGDLKINGTLLSDSSLPSHIDALEMGQETKVRVSASDMVYTGLINKISRELVLKEVEQVEINMMTPEAFKQFENDLIIDIMSNGKIMLDGNLLYPADLSVALKNNSELISDTKVRLYVNDMASMGTVTDIQKILVSNKVTQISNQTDRS